MEAGRWEESLVPWMVNVLDLLIRKHKLGAISYDNWDFPMIIMIYWLILDVAALYTNPVCFFGGICPKLTQLLLVKLLCENESRFSVTSADKPHSSGLRWPLEPWGAKIRTGELKVPKPLISVEFCVQEISWWSPMLMIVYTSVIRRPWT